MNNDGTKKQGSSSSTSKKPRLLRNFDVDELWRSFQNKSANTDLAHFVLSMSSKSLKRSN